MTDSNLEQPIVAVAAEAKPELPRAAESRTKVLVLLFVVLGPLALGVLWKSPRFSPAWKVVLTVLTLGQFVLVVWLLWYWVRWFLASLAKAGVFRP